MGRPLGSKNKTRQGDEEVISANVNDNDGLVEVGPQVAIEEPIKEEVKVPHEPVKVVEVKQESVKKKTAHERAIEESRKVLEHPLSPGQRFFEAPDGYIIVGEADAQKILYRAGNDGKGMYINPMR